MGMSGVKEGRFERPQNLSSNFRPLIPKYEADGTVTCDKADHTGTFRIYHKFSEDLGDNWSDDILLTPEGSDSEFPYPAVDGNTIHLAWRDRRDGNSEIYYKKSSDGGYTWSDDHRLTDNPNESEHPKMVASGNNVLVTWRDDRDGSHDIYAVRSSDGGKNWTDLIKLVDSPGQSFWPTPTLDNGVIHLAWVNMQEGDCMIYHKYSEDAGESWSEESMLSSCVMPFDAGVLGLHPLVVGGGKVHLVFNDDRTGASDIYYLAGDIN